MIPRPLFSVLWGEENNSMLCICFRDSKFTNLYIRWHSIIKRPNRIFFTFFLDERKLRIRAGPPMKQPFETSTTWLTYRPQPSLTIPSLEYSEKKYNSIIFLFSNATSAGPPKNSRRHPLSFPYPLRSSAMGETWIPGISLNRNIL